MGGCSNDDDGRGICIVCCVACYMVISATGVVYIIFVVSYIVVVDLVMHVNVFTTVTIV